MSFLIAQISDTHLSAQKPFFVENFEAVAESLGESLPDLVVNTGDVSLNGADLREDLETGRDLHERIGLTWRAIPGNHDIGDNRETETKQPVDAERVARWREVMGADFWQMEAPGWLIIGLNSLVLGSGLDADREQIAFLSESVAGLDGRALLLFLHKPLFDADPGETEVSGRFVNPEPRRVLFETLGDIRPRLVGCGHVHQYRDHVASSMRHIWAPGTSFIVPRWFGPDYGIRTIGYVEHLLEPDGSFASRFTSVGGTVVHDLGNIPEAYGDLRRYRERAHA
ncbi:MAG: metallophosphoesterase family protein [Hyphomicrobiales bacterium]